MAKMQIVGHRGASDDAPENTLESLMLAWEQGAYAAECDIILTKDLRLVLMHDDSTQRTALGGIDLIVEKTVWSELQKLDVGRWKGEKWSGVRIPLLEDVLRAIPDGKHLFIEIKTGDANSGADPRVIDHLPELVEKEMMSPDKISFICFDHLFLNRLKKRLPDYRAYYLTTFQPQPGKWPDVRNDEELEYSINEALRNGIDGLDMENSGIIQKEWVERIHESTLKIGIWSYGTDDTLENARRYNDIGIDFFTTNMPAVVLKMLGRS
jgi:glycerophosphoryl diester phosphodiesterase